MCVRNCCGGVRDVSVGSRDIRRRARPCAAMASKNTAYDAAVVLLCENCEIIDAAQKKHKKHVLAESSSEQCTRTKRARHRKRIELQ